MFCRKKIRHGFVLLCANTIIIANLTLAGCNSTTYSNNNSNYTNKRAAKQLGSHNKIDLDASAKFNVQLGLGYLEQGDVERAKDKFLKAIRQAPTMPEAHYNIAHFYYLIDEHQLADKHFNIAINNASSHNEYLSTGVLGTAQNNYGVYLCQTKQYEKALEQFNEAASDVNYSNSASAYENAGLCALLAENKTQALDYFDLAVKRNPLAPKALIELGQLNFEKEKYNKAKLYMHRYSQVSKPSKRSLLLSLKIAKKLGDSKDINLLIDTIQKKYPDIQLETLEENNNKIAVSNIQYTELGSLNKIA